MQNKKKVLSFLIIVILVIIALLSLVFFDDTELYGPYDVTKVVDGDTLIINIDNVDTKVRILCINAPESVHNDETKNTEEGKQASKLLKELIGNKRVYLEYDEEMYDQYGRVLAYVYLDDKKTMLDIEMVKLGYAKAVIFEPNRKYYEDICYYEKQAKENNLGLWGTGFYN